MVILILTPGPQLSDGVGDAEPFKNRVPKKVTSSSVARLPEHNISSAPDWLAEVMSQGYFSQKASPPSVHSAVY
ncbi:hypothetical protein EYF80_024251 [Liparis tanakae]|uniref:Uncharacterized protein n=1 Tax=Liparis tanakae TaxID=230148 RepID=A0A4Z2HKR8_9TELE|nr:hypothetical protein EYF80_024251 [Liparis tanakae]